jgi:uncharacterized protein involved in response to NO
VRNDERLLVSRGFALGFVCLNFSVLLRLAATAGMAIDLGLPLSAAFWATGWGAFVWDFRYALRGPVQRPILSARTKQHASTPHNIPMIRTRWQRR